MPNPMGRGIPGGYGIGRISLEFPGEKVTQWGRIRRLGGSGDSFTFRAGKAKIRLLLKSTRILIFSKQTPRNKRAICHQ